MSNNGDNKIYLSQEGYEKYLRELEELEQKLSDNGANKGYAYENSGDGFHDNFEFEQSEIKERGLLYQLKEKREGLDRIVIVEKQNNDDVVDIDDSVSLTVDYGGGDTETTIFKLVGVDSFDYNSDIDVITINSPLGKAIYKKHVGEDTTYSVEKAVFKVHINEIVKQIDDDIKPSTL